MTKIILILLAYFTIGYGIDNHPIKENGQNIFILDTIITKTKNLTIPGRHDQIIYHLMVEDWKKPVFWSLYIISNQDTLFHESSYDEGINHFFEDPMYIGNCESDYIDCKKKWYLEKIYNFYIDIVTLDDTWKRTFFADQSKYFAINKKGSYGGNYQISIKNWELFWEYYNDKPIPVFVFYCAPEACRTPLLSYHPKLNKFVPIYHP